MLTTINYREIAEKISEKNNEPEWLRKKRLKALEYFQATRTPVLKYGLNIRLDFELDIDNFGFSGENNNKLKIEVSGKADVKNIFQDPELQDYFMKAVTPDNKFLNMHLAFFNHGLLIRVPAGKKAEIKTSSVMASESLLSHLIIVAEPNSKLTIIERVEGSGKLRSDVVEVFPKEGARIKYISVQNLKGVHSFSTKKALPEKDAQVDWLACCFGSKFSKLQVDTVLKGKGSSTNNHCLFFGKINQQFEISSSSIHAAPNTYSNMVTKGSLDDSAKTVYQGLIKINDNAPNSNGYQKEDTLMLSERAEINPIPNLEIGNNEVKCSHGATVGQVDREKLFYLKSRGLEEKDATALLVQGFFESMLSNLEEGLRNNIMEIIKRKVQC